MSRIRPASLLLLLAALDTSPAFLLAAPPTATVEKKPAHAEKKTAVATHPQDTTEPAARGDKWWTERQKQLNESVKKTLDTQLLMIGDSITQGWEGAGKDVWQKYYSKRHAVNLGIGGDRTQHVLWRLEHGNVDGITPKLAVLMIGTNNSHDNTSEQIANGVEAIVKKLRAKLPGTKVLILGIFPRGKDAGDPARKVNAGANSRLVNLEDGKHVFFLDIGNRFLSADGSLSTEIMPDRLHLSPQGYEIWASAIEPTVKKLLGDT